MAMDSKVWLAFFQAMNLGMEVAPPLSLSLKPRWTRMMRSECGYGNGASKIALTTEKIAVLAPMPSARAATATVVNPGLTIRTRREWRRSETRLLMLMVRATWRKVRTIVRLAPVPLTDVRGSVDSACYRTATVRERLAPCV